MNRKSKISSFSEILNLCAFVKTFEQRTDDHVDKVIKEMNEIALHSSDDQVKKISFLLEQISLLLEPKKRQYSNSLLVSSFIIYSNSSAAYRALLQEDILILPSEKTPKIISEVTLD